MLGYRQLDTVYIFFCNIFTRLQMSLRDEIWIVHYTHLPNVTENSIINGELYFYI
jgi:hypothetical protein